MHALGVAPRPLRHTKITAPSLGAAISQALADSEIRQRAADLGARIHGENGVGEAVRDLEEIHNGHR
jgi:sterol 3beta-glucosyltransferase